MGWNPRPQLRTGLDTAVEVAGDAVFLTSLANAFRTGDEEKPVAPVLSIVRDEPEPETKEDEI